MKQKQFRKAKILAEESQEDGSVDKWLPSTVKVGYAIYQIKYYDEITYQGLHYRYAGTADSDGQCPMGITFKQSHVIMLYSGQPPCEMAATLLHEILHACYYIFAIDSGGTDQEDREERVVTSVSNALSTFMVDNPQVSEWIYKTMRSQTNSG